MTRWLAPAIDTLPGARYNLSNYPFLAFLHLRNGIFRFGCTTVQR